MRVGLMRWLYAKPHDAMVDIRWAVMEWRADRENPEGPAFDNVSDLLADLREKS